MVSIAADSAGPNVWSSSTSGGGGAVGALHAHRQTAAAASTTRGTRGPYHWVVL